MFNSVRMRLTAWYAGALALSLALFAVSTYLFLSRAVYRQTDETLREISRAFVDAAAREQADEGENDEEAATKKSAGKLSAIREAADDLSFKNYRIFVFEARGELVAATAQATGESDLPADDLAKQQFDFSNSAIDSTIFSAGKGEKVYRAFGQKLRISGENLTVFVAHPLAEEENLLERFRHILFVCVPLALFPATFGGYFLARKSLSPVVAMSAAAAEIGAKNLHERRLIVKNERDELGALARGFNDLLTRLDEAFARQKRFMADASHEFRTPIAIVRGESEVALSKENRAASDYRESLAVVQSESRRMTVLVEDLFTLARADAGQFPLLKTDFYLDEMLGECVRAVKTLAEKADVFLSLEAAAEMPLSADEALVRRLFLNLLENAVKNTAPRGSVKIAAERAGDFYAVRVVDTGKGIAPEDAPHIFERFFRADKSRARGEKDGAGLGLSIALWIAEAHDGTLTLEQSDAAGSIFLVKLPAFSVV